MRPTSHSFRRLAPLALLLATVAVTALSAAGDGSTPARAAAAAVSPTPPVTAGLQLWFEADTETEGDGQPVASWTDKSGFGRTLTAAAGGEATMRRNAVNGRAAVELNGTTSLLKTYGSTFTIAQPDTFFLVYRAADPDTSVRAFTFDSTNSNVRQVFGRSALHTERMYANIDMDAGGVAFPFAGYDLWSGTYNGTSSSLYRNGTLVLNGNAGGSALSGLTLGGLSTTGTFGYDMSHSYVSELLVYSGTMTAAQRQSMVDWLNQKYGFNAPATPPVNTVLPSVPATSIHPSDAVFANPGTWTGTTPTFMYQWQRCNAAGASCVDSNGPTGLNERGIGDTDVGFTLRVVVTATNAAGSASATSPVSVVVQGWPPSASQVTITGTAQQGQTLTASAAGWSGTALTYTYQWQRCNSSGASCAAISDATVATYALVAADVDSTIRVVITGTNAWGSATRSSVQTAQVVPPPAGADPPPITAGLQLWFDANQEAYADGAAVPRWIDRSGLGRDLTAFDSASTATFRRNAVNGRTAIEFNGSTSLLKTYGSTFTIAQPDTFFIVYRQLDTVGANIFDSTNAIQRQSFGRASSATLDMYADVDLLAADTFPMAGYELWSGTYSGTQSSLSKNGVQVATGRAGSASMTGFTLGALSTSGQYGYQYSHSFVAEILWYQGTLTPAQQQQITTWLNTKYGFLAPPTAPVNTAPPSVTGNARDGSTVTAANGTWTGASPITFGYQWQRCNSIGTACSNIAGQTSASYPVGPSDVLSTLRVVVTATNSVGSASVTTAASAVVTASPPVNSALPLIVGSTALGQTLSTTNGTWTGTAPISYGYQWQRCDSSGANCAAIAAATTAVYTLVAADVGSTIRVAVLASNMANAATATSPQTVVVTPQVTGDAPPVTAGLQLWFDANQEAYADGAAVTKWTDRSGFGRNLTAFDSSAAATFRRSAVNGRPAVEFNGSSSLLKTYGSTFTIAQPDTYFIVYKQLDPGEAYIYDSTNSAVRQLLGRGPFTDVEMYADVDLVVNAYTFPFASYELWAGTYNGDASTLYKNGNLMATGRAGASGLQGFTVGALSTSAQYGYLYSHSLVAEILWYSGSLSAADRTAVTNWLKARYALP